MPSCSNGVTDMFEASPWDFDDFRRGCQARWGVTPRPNWILEQFGGRNITAASNIIFRFTELIHWINPLISFTYFIHLLHSFISFTYFTHLFRILTTESFELRTLKKIILCITVSIKIKSSLLLWDLSQTSFSEFCVFLTAMVNLIHGVEGECSDRWAKRLLRSWSKMPRIISISEARIRTIRSPWSEHVHSRSRSWRAGSRTVETTSRRTESRIAWVKIAFDSANLIFPICLQVTKVKFYFFRFQVSKFTIYFEQHVFMRAYCNTRIVIYILYTYCNIHIVIYVL